METQHTIVWFEDGDVYTLADLKDHTILLSAAEATQQHIPVLSTEDQIDDADEDVRYAIPVDLFEDLFGEISG